MLYEKPNKKKKDQIRKKRPNTKRIHFKKFEPFEKSLFKYITHKMVISSFLN